MGKNTGPFRRAERGGIYYCWIGGKLRSLRTRKPRIAEGNYRELLKRKEQGRTEVFTVRQAFDAYLAGIENPETLKSRRKTLDRFCREAKVGPLPWHDLTADHLEAWMKRFAWSPNMRRSVINRISAAFNHCRKRRLGGVTDNPVSAVPKPTWRRRKVAMAPDTEQVVYDAARGPFRDILTVLRLGARPSELCRAKAEDYRAGMIVLEEHKTDDTGEPRIIYLDAEARAVVERLVASRQPGEPIFLNGRNQPWKPDTLYCRFKRLRKKLGLGPGVFPYAMRGNFASRAINDGNANPALVAKALGHGDLKMLLKHYLREDPEAVRKMLDELGKPT